MKILYHHRTRSKDGQYVHIEEMIRALRDLGHEVIIVAPSSADTKSLGFEGGPVKWLKRYVPRFAYELAELAYSVVAFWRLARAVRRHNPDFLYERYNLFLPSGVWIKKKYGLPLLLEVNAPIFEERARYDGIALNWLARWSQKYVWRGADIVLPVTHVLANMVDSYGVSQSKIEVIHNGINAKRFGGAVEAQEAKAVLGLQGKLVLGFTGFVREWHGLDKVLDMMATDRSESNRFLLVVGDGPARPGLERQATILGIRDRVHFTGTIERDEIARYIAAFDIALQPSVVPYASPLKLFEYLALGKAIVGPAQPNIREILTSEYSALLFDPTNSEGLPEAISRLCSDSELRLFLGDNARKTIEEKRFTWNSNAQRVIELFNGFCQRSRSSLDEGRMQQDRSLAQIDE